MSTFNKRIQELQEYTKNTKKNKRGKGRNYTEQIAIKVTKDTYLQLEELLDSLGIDKPNFLRYCINLGLDELKGG